MLIEKGADIHVKSKNGATSLHDASLNGHTETAMMLIEKGADIHEKDNA
jgi:ankyrin repeat protein